MPNTSLRVSPTLSLCSMEGLSTSGPRNLLAETSSLGTVPPDALFQPPLVARTRSAAGVAGASGAAGAVAGDRGCAGRAGLAGVGAARGSGCERGGADARAPARARGGDQRALAFGRRRDRPRHLRRRALLRSGAARGGRRLRDDAGAGGRRG